MGHLGHLAIALLPPMTNHKRSRRDAQAPADVVSFHLLMAIASWHRSIRLLQSMRRLQVGGGDPPGRWVGRGTNTGRAPPVVTATHICWG